MTDTYYIIAVGDNGIVVGGKVEPGNTNIALIPCVDGFRSHENYGATNEAKARAAKDVLGAIMPDADDELTDEERLDGYEPTM